MKTYKVTFTLTFGDDVSHPNRWLPEAIHANLEPGEDASGFEYEEVEQPVATKE